jgi:hypothetical protein
MKSASADGVEGGEAVGAGKKETRVTEGVRGG